MQPTDPQFLSNQPDLRSDTPEFLPQTIPVIEETARIEKQVVETGRVVIRKTVHQETQTVDVPAQHEQVHVERVPVNQYVDVAPAVRQEGDTMIIPVLREEVVVTKRILVVEELHVRKQVVSTSFPQQVELRREEVHYERLEGTDSPPSGPAPTP